MSLSKIYRGSETTDLKEFRFRSFGETDPLALSDGDKPPLAALSDPTTTPPMPVGLSSQQLEEAFSRGKREGINIAEAQLESVTQALTQSLEDVSRLRESLAASGAQDMLRLVMAVAEQIVRRTIEVDKNTILTIIENALQASVRADTYRIRVSPDDLKLVTKQKPLFLASISGLKNLSFEADPEIPPGGCRVDSELGEVDATIETQLDAIRQALSAAITED